MTYQNLLSHYIINISLGGIAICTIYQVDTTAVFEQHSFLNHSSRNIITYSLKYIGAHELFHKCFILGDLFDILGDSSRLFMHFSCPTPHQVGRPTAICLSTLQAVLFFGNAFYCIFYQSFYFFSNTITFENSTGPSTYVVSLIKKKNLYDCFLSKTQGNINKIFRS